MAAIDLTRSQARIIDPVLTEVALGYHNPANVGEMLMPRVMMESSGGRVPEFGQEAFFDYDTERAPGTDTLRVSFKWSSQGVATEEHSIEGMVPWEIMRDANAVPGIDSATVAIEGAKDVVDRKLERAIANLVFNTNNFNAANTVSLAGTHRWDSGNENDADPIDDVATAMSAVELGCGRQPNVMVISSETYNKLKTNAKIVDRIKHTSRDSVTVEALARLFDIETLLVGRAIYKPDGTAESANFTRIWGKHAALLVVNRASVASMGTPAWGYTYTVRNYPQMEEPYADRGKKSWMYPYTDSRIAKVAMKSAGYLIQNVIS